MELAKAHTSDVDDTIISEGISETDVFEVWFSGCHTGRLKQISERPVAHVSFEDVGGGSVVNTAEYSLADIPLYWMVREVVRSQCGIKFDEDALQRLQIPASVLSDPDLPLPTSPSTTASPTVANGSDIGPTNGHVQMQKPPPTSPSPWQVQMQIDAIQPLHDGLAGLSAWWILEVLPLENAHQDESGQWHTTFGSVLFYVIAEFRTESFGFPQLASRKGTKNPELHHTLFSCLCQTSYGR